MITVKVGTRHYEINEDGTDIPGRKPGSLGPSYVHYPAQRRSREREQRREERREARRAQAVKLNVPYTRLLSAERLAARGIR
jgi:hypothetical protein